MSRRVIVGCLLAAGLAVSTAAPAQAAPAWTSYSPSFTVQQQGCGSVSGLTFTINCTSSSGYDRAERRYQNYTHSQHRFQGSFRITSMGGTRMSLKQTFRDGVGPFFLLAVERGGRLYSVEGGATIATGATVGTTVAVQTIHRMGNDYRVYINGSLKYTESAPPSGNYYDKIGAYRTASGSGSISVVWSNLSFAYQ
ncbi:hypothetical protein [Fodinicola acaciae]|uniref:hypothetical protein n=1 Tax=Fodinicola acaciae TaxID=2681555 RepID=UPI001C9E8644|nr:hypothetical protein [Fodinicola acaciae]